MSVKPHGKDELENLGEQVHAVGAAKEGGFLPQAEHAGDDGGKRSDQRGGAGLSDAPLTQGEHKDHQRAGQEDQFGEEGHEGEDVMRSSVMGRRNPKPEMHEIRMSEAESQARLNAETRRPENRREQSASERDSESLRLSRPRVSALESG